MRSHASALVLEDNRHMRFMLSQLLYGLEVEQVDAVGAIQEARSHIDYLGCDFALIDVGLCGENGPACRRGGSTKYSSPSRRVPGASRQRRGWPVAGQATRGSPWRPSSLHEHAYIETRIEAEFPMRNAPRAADAKLRSVDPDCVF